jgi:hypothetical protein
MLPDRADRDHEVIGDLAVPDARREEAYDLVLTGRRLRTALSLEVVGSPHEGAGERATASFRGLPPGGVFPVHRFCRVL